MIVRFLFEQVGRGAVLTTKKESRRSWKNVMNSHYFSLGYIKIHKYMSRPGGDAQLKIEYNTWSQKRALNLEANQRKVLVQE